MSNETEQLQRTKPKQPR